MLLRKVNSLSEELQQSTVCLPIAIELMSSIRTQLTDCRNEETCSKLQKESSEIAETIGIDVATIEREEQR